MKNISPLESVFVATTTFVSLISGLALAPNCSLAATVGSEEVYAEIIVNPSRTFTPFTDEFDITFEVDLADGNTNPIGWASPSYIYPNLKPGFAYTMEVDGTYNDEFDVEFDVDRDNFRLYIDGVESYRVEKSPAYPPLFSYDYEIMLECKSCADSGSIPAGYSTKMTTSGKFIWEVSMGRLSSGQSAGTIAIREEEITSSIFSASALIYNSNSSEVEILKEGSTLRQVKAHQTLADIIPITDGYEIKFYPREDIGSKTGSGCGGSGCFDVSSADPFVAFKFERETSGNDNKLKITRTRYDSDPDETWVTNIDDTSGVWATTTEDNLRKIDSTNSETGGVRTETTEVKHGVTPYPLATRTDRLYKTFAGEERVWKVIEDPDAPAYGGAEYTTEFDYYTDSQEEATYGKEKWVKYPDGNWEHYTYYTSGDSAGMLHKIFTPFKDAPTLPTSADATNQNKTRATIYTYADDCDGASVLRNTVEVTVGDGTSSNTRVSYTELLHDYDGTFNSEPIHIVTRKDHYKSGTNYYTTVRASYRADAGGGLAGRTIFVKSPDRSMRYTTYEEGEVTYNGTSKQWEFGGSSGNPIGWRISTHYGTSSSTGVTIATIDGTVFKMIDEKSHKEVVIIDDRGHSVRTEMHIYDTGFVLAGYTDSVYNDAGNLTESVDDRGRKYSATWVNGLKTSETNVDGTITDFTNDALGRLIQTDRASATVDSLSIPSVRSYYLFDASSRLLKREIGTSSKITTEWDYDYAGRLEEKEEFSTAASAYQFTTSYTYANGGRTVTVTKPGSGDEGGGTAVTANFYDGRVKSLTGTGVIEKHYDYGVDGSAYEWAMVRVGDSSSTRKTTTTYNWVGNMIKEEMPTDDGGADFKREYFYSPDNYPSISGEGFLSRVTETDLADQYFEYDTMGRHIKEGLDFDDGSSNDYTDLVADSDDRISERDVSYSYNATSQDWWLKVEDSVYGINADGTHSSSSTPVLISKNLARLTGFATNVVAESYIFDAHNSESSKIVRTTEIDRASKKRLEKVNYPDSSTVETTTFGNGLPIKHISAQNVTTKSYYDAWGRIDKVNDRTGDHVSTYESETTLLTKINTPSNSDPEFDYDSAGRRNEVKRPKAASNYVTAYTEYDKLGRVVKRWGSAVNPVEFQYDEQTIKYGDLWKQKTYRGGDFSTATWPGSPGTADVTEYDYDVATGLLAKTTTADSKEVRYTYTDRGQVRTKRWAREVIAGGSEDHPYIYYAYHSATGELTNKYYKKTSGADPASNPLGDSDEGTSNITFTYTRLGSLKSVTDYVGTRNFTYRTSDFQLDQEKLGTGHGTNKMITREYYNSTSGGYYQGKYRGVKYGLTTDDDKYVQARYTFESTTGRINEIDYYRSGSNNLQFDYSYLANSNLVSGIDLETDEEDAYEVNRTWESDRNLLQSSEYEWNSSDKALNYYKYDWLGRRTEEFQRGEVYDIYQEEPTSSGVDGIMVQYGYSDRSELTSAISHLDTNSSGSFVVGSADDTEVYGRSFQYS